MFTVLASLMTCETNTLKLIWEHVISIDVSHETCLNMFYSHLKVAFVFSNDADFKWVK